MTMDTDVIKSEIAALQQKLRESGLEDKPEGVYAIVRCRDAGVHAGTIVGIEGRAVRLRNSRRIWYWSGAKTLSELAVYGVAHPEKCKYGCVVENIQLLEACEVIECTVAGRESVEGVHTWKE